MLWGYVFMIRQTDYAIKINFHVLTIFRYNNYILWSNLFVGCGIVFYDYLQSFRFLIWWMGDDKWLEQRLSYSVVVEISYAVTDNMEWSQIVKFMGPTWGPPGSCRPQMGPMLAPRTLLSGVFVVMWRCFISASLLDLSHVLSSIEQVLTHWGPDKMVVILQTIFSNGYFCMSCFCIYSHLTEIGSWECNKQ